MTLVILTRPGNIDRDSEDRHVLLPGIGWDFFEMMAEARKVVPDRSFEYFESLEKPD